MLAAEETRARTALAAATAVALDTSTRRPHLDQARFLEALFRAAGPRPRSSRRGRGQGAFLRALKGRRASARYCCGHSASSGRAKAGRSTRSPVIQDGYVLGRGRWDFKGGQACSRGAVLMLVENQ